MRLHKYNLIPQSHLYLLLNENLTQTKAIMTLIYFLLQKTFISHILLYSFLFIKFKLYIIKIKNLKNFQKLNNLNQVRVLTVFLFTVNPLKKIKKSVLEQRSANCAPLKKIWSPRACKCGPRKKKIKLVFLVI